MKLLFNLFFVIAICSVCVLGQAPTPTPLPSAQGMKIEIISDQSGDTPPVKLSSPIISSEKNNLLIVYLTSRPGKDSVRFQLLLFSRDSQIGMTDDLPTSGTALEELTKIEGVPLFATDFFNLQLKLKSDENVNSELDNTPTIIRSRNFITELTKEQVELLTRTSTISVAFNEFQAAATPESLAAMKGFIEDELRTFAANRSKLK